MMVPQLVGMVRLHGSFGGQAPLIGVLTAARVSMVPQLVENTVTCN